MTTHMKRALGAVTTYVSSSRHMVTDCPITDLRQETFKKMTEVAEAHGEHGSEKPTFDKLVGELELHKKISHSAESSEPHSRAYLEHLATHPPTPRAASNGGSVHKM